jgi:ribose 5-phosphate isomerase B
MLKSYIPMKIALGADHAGYELKQQLSDALRAAGHEPLDFGTHSAESTDYPDYAGEVARRVAAGAADRGVLVCGSGVGMSIAANKVAGVRCALGYSVEQARLTRSHNDANVLSIGARFTGRAQAIEIMFAFLETAFEGGRHARRVEKISQLESGSKLTEKGAAQA